MRPNLATPSLAMARTAVVAALLAAGPLAARADQGGIALSLSGAAGALGVTSQTLRGGVTNTYPLLEAHVEAGLPLRGGALVLLGNLALPLNQKGLGPLLSVGGGLRLGPPFLLLTLGGGYTIWAGGTADSLTGPSLFAHLAIPLLGGFGLHLNAQGHFLGPVSGIGATLGVGFSD